MTNPGITICPHSKHGILSRTTLLSLYAGHSQIADSNMQNQTGEAYLQLVTLMKNIKKIYHELGRIPVFKTNKTNKQLLRLNMWRDKKENLLDGKLLPAFINLERYLARIPTIPEDNIFLCQLQNTPCSRQTVIDNISLKSMHGGLATCFQLDITLGGALNPATSQGITNGLTLIILDGTNVVDKVINKSFAHPIPFFDDIISPNSGLSGLRLIAHGNDTTATPIYQGIDIPTGKAVSIGLTARKVTHLPEPYTKCSDGINDEIFREMGRKVGKRPNIQKNDRKAYSQRECRYNIAKIQSVII